MTLLYNTPHVLAIPCRSNRFLLGILLEFSGDLFTLLSETAFAREALLPPKEVR